jgi:catechol 2,3-dioxygenase-like lactoylglutathione lyase family enzyme
MSASRRSRSVVARPVVVGLAVAILVARPARPHAADAPAPTPISVASVDRVGFTVGDMDRSLRFYSEILGFEKTSDVELAGREVELLHGVFGARMRVVSMRLGDETIELTEYLAPKGRPMPDNVRPNDRIFQHVAIIVSDMDKAYARLRQFGVMHASTGPQLLPDWNKNAGGISAFYFRDPDRHFLEILHFPPGKGLDKWQRKDRLFLGIDHTAIVVDDSDETLRFYRDLLGMKVAGESENYDTEQEHLNNVFGARLRITALRASAGPGIELLEYLAPRDGRPAPLDLRANDIAHWQTTLLADAPDHILGAIKLRVFGLVSPGMVSLPSNAGFASAVLLRDRDGHGVRIASRKM